MYLLYLSMKKPRGIRYVTNATLSWRRSAQGSGFRYTNRLGKQLREKEVERIKQLVIPPAWQDVKICSNPSGHIQATGVDAKGRKQYIYHPDWVAYNQQSKFDSLQQFGKILPTLRETVNGHMRQHTLSRERVLATVVWLLEHTFIRVGNAEYAKENQSYGLTTLRTKHIDVEGSLISFSFKGKSNVYHEMDVRHPRIAATIKACIELPGYQIFKYLDDNGKRHRIDSAEVNDYLKEITGEALSAKDFRTWGGTILAGDTLYAIGSPSEEITTEKALVQAVQEVADHLGNTTAVCRQYYIHPTIITSYEKNTLVPHFKKIESALKGIPEGLTWEEYATLSLL